jgi:hypothetical protein
VAAILDGILRRLQQAKGMRTFGACKNCRHHQLQDDGSRRCGLTSEALTDADAEKLCREHEPPEAAKASADG